MGIFPWRRRAQAVPNQSFLDLPLHHSDESLEWNSSTTTVSGRPTQPQGYQAAILGKKVGWCLIGALVFLAILLMVFFGVVNEVIHGVGPVASTTDNGGWVHYLWSAPTITLVVVSSGLSAAIAAMDFSLKRLEPYRRLSQGRVSANHSLLLDYVSMPHFIAPQKAFRNRHYIVMASSVATLLSLVLSPLASSVFVVRAAQLHQGISGFISQSVGFSAQWDALIPAYNAVNAVASMFLSEGTPPQYVYASWAFPAFELFYEPTPGISDNGNFTVELPTIVTEDGCEETNITYQDQGPGNSSFRYLATVTGVRSGATFTVELPGFGTTQYNGSIAPFNNQTDPRRQSFVYTIYTPLTEDESESDTAGPANMSAMICSPTIYLQNTVAFMGASTREVWGVLSPADSVKQPLDILNGSAAAFNGYYFDTSKYGPIVENRKKATMFGLVSVMYEAAAALPGGLVEAYERDMHFEFASEIYSLYLSSMARTTYFNNNQPSGSLIFVSSVVTQNLLFVSPISAGFMAGVLLVLAALVGGVLHAHRRTFAGIVLRADPSTMAGQGMLLAGGSDVARLLESPEMTQREMKDTLRRHLWRLAGGKVCVEDDEGASMKEGGVPEEARFMGDVA